MKKAEKLFKDLLSENLGYIDLKPINQIEATPKTNFENKFAEFLAEESKKEKEDEAVKVESKKVAKSVEEVAESNFDYKDVKNLDNQIGQEVLNGIYFEAKQNPDKSLEEIREIVSKNLAKDGQHYINNAMFGVDGLKAETMKCEEVSGKHAASGYSDKVKEVVKESLMGGITNIVKEEEEEKEAPKPKKAKKAKKESLDNDLAEIDKQAQIVALEAKLDKMDEVIEGKMSRINMVSEDENLSELVDSKKMKVMQKEVKILEKRKAKMEKMYEKMCGKKYQKEEIVGEDYTVNEILGFGKGTKLKTNQPVYVEFAGDQEPLKFKIKSNKFGRISEPNGGEGAKIQFKSDKIEVGKPLIFTVNTGGPTFKDGGKANVAKIRTDGKDVKKLDIKNVDGGFYTKE